MKPMQYMAPLGALIFSTSSLLAADNEVRLADCPEPVRATIESNSRDGKIDEIEKFEVEGKEVYVVDVDLPADVDRKMYITSGGTLIKTREDVPMKEVPEAIRTAASQFGGSIDEVEKEIKDGATTFHVEIDVKGGPDLDLILSEAGEVLKKTEDPD